VSLLKTMLAPQRHSAMPGQGCPKCDDGAYYRIGTKGQAWGAAERSMWLNQTRRKRSYHDEVLSKLDALGEGLVVHDYGSLSTAPERYPLKAVTTADWDGNKPCVLVTGGVHGYETSGVQGALLFLNTKLAEYRDSFNICVAPCVSPFGYEHVERWNAHCTASCGRDDFREFLTGKTMKGRYRRAW